MHVLENVQSCRRKSAALRGNGDGREGEEHQMNE